MRQSCFTLAAVCALVAAQACSAEDVFRVAGTVVNTVTHSPLPHAYVLLYRTGGDKPVAEVVTGDDGRFSFQLPAGVYRLSAGTRDDWEAYGSRDPSVSIASSVIVGPGKDTSALEFHFYPPMAISGRVVDEAGEPARQVLVQLVRAAVILGRREASVFAWRWTDDQGEYRFDHLPGGAAYYLAVSGQPWYSQQYGKDTSGDRVEAAYAPVFYPGVSDPGQATPLSPQPGQEARADFRLNTVPNATVSVKYVSPPGIRGTVSLTTVGVAGTSAVQQSQQLTLFPQMPLQAGGQPSQRASGTVFRNVPPGHYTLRITGVASGNAMGVTKPVDVNGADVDLDVELTPLSKIEGTVHFPGGVAPKSPITVTIRGQLGGQNGSLAVQADGSFAAPNVAPGKFSIGLGGTGFFVSKLEARDGTVKDGLVEIPEHTTVNLTITASAETGELKGFAVEGTRPLEGVMVFLVSSPGDRAAVGSEDRIRAYQTESDGSFDFLSVPAGRYRIFAVDQPALEYASPEAIAPYLAGAKEVEVPAHALAEVNVSLMAAPGR